MSLLHSYIKRVLYQNIYTETYEDMGDGGPACYHEMSVEYRIVCALISIPIQCLLFWISKKKIQEKFFKDQKHSKELSPSIIEMMMGIISILLFATNTIYKFIAGKGIFMLNPCHMVLLLQAYLLLTTKTGQKNYTFAIFISLLFAPLSGSIFYVTCGLDQPYEIELYFIEHYIAAFVNPFALSLSGRYHDRSYFSIYYRLIGFAVFSLYHRVFLTPLALMTWANLDQTLCHSDSDPFWSLLGTWYLIGADIYIFIGSCIVGTLYLSLIEMIWIVARFIKKMTYGKKLVKKID